MMIWAWTRRLSPRRVASSLSEHSHTTPFAGCALPSSPVWVNVALALRPEPVTRAEQPLCRSHRSVPSAHAWWSACSLLLLRLLFPVRPVLSTARRRKRAPRQRQRQAARSRPRQRPAIPGPCCPDHTGPTSPYPSQVHARNLGHKLDTDCRSRGSGWVSPAGACCYNLHGAWRRVRSVVSWRLPRVSSGAPALSSSSAAALEAMATASP